MELEHHTRNAYNLDSPGTRTKAGYDDRKEILSGATSPLFRKIKNIGKKLGVVKKPAASEIPLPAQTSEEPGLLQKYGLYIAAAGVAFLAFRRR